MRHTPEEIASSIAEGHSFAKHVLERKEFSPAQKRYGPDTRVRTREEFEAHILETITARGTKAFEDANGWVHFYNKETNTYVFHDKEQHDLGSCYRPGRRNYFENVWSNACAERGEWQRDKMVEKGGYAALLEKLGRQMPSPRAEPTPKKSPFELAGERAQAALDAENNQRATPRHRDPERER